MTEALSTPWRKFAAYMDMIFVDHGFVRVVYNTRSRVSEKMYRSSQPGPPNIWGAARVGVKTIINLRGARDCGSYHLEKAACERHGITLIDFPVGSREAPKKANLIAAADLFERIEYPALMHCKSGADRAGFMAALYLLVQERRSLDDAFGQLHWRYGHIRQSKTGILDYFFERFGQETSGELAAFYHWVEHEYDPSELKETFMSNWWANTVVDKILRRE
jgi:protein tyrosine/serine phosphatase